MRIHAFLSATHFTLYLDTSGEPLFKRGYGKAAGEAPLRENLAAGILRLAGWNPPTPLLDPMCGSGTFLCEAAMIALDRAPGLDRDVRLREARDVRRARVEEARATPRAHACATARALADLRQRPLWRCAQARAREPRGARRRRAASRSSRRTCSRCRRRRPPASIVTNPPYGVRLQDQRALAALYPRLGDALKKKYAGWTAYIFTADLRLPKLIGLAAVAPHAALQRRARVPAVRVSHRRRQHASQDSVHKAPHRR